MNKYFYNFINVMSLCLVLISSVHSQSFSGYILDSRSSEPLVGATVYCNEDHASITDINGYFQLESCPKDSFRISYIGYENNFIITKDWKNGTSILLNSSTSILNSVTVTGSKYKENAARSVVSLESISVERIKREGTPNLKHFLNTVVGVQIIDGQPNIRGGSGWSYGAGSRVMLLVDGLSILQGDAASPNWRDLPTENISRIEVLKGASSILYGSSALNGVIHVETEFPGTVPETEVMTQVEIFDSPAVDSMKWWSKSPAIYTGSVVHRQKFGKLDVVGSMFYYDEQSYIKGKTAELKRGTLKLRYRLKPEWVIGINANINDYQGNSPFYWENYGAGTLISDTASYSLSNSSRFNIDPYIKYSDKNGGEHKLQTRYYSISNEVERDRANKSNQFFGEYQYTKRIERYDMTFTGGILMSSLKSDSELYSNEIFFQNNLGVYTQIEKNIGDKLKLIAGLRYELNKTKTPDSIHLFKIDKSLNKYDKTVARLGLNYEFNKYNHIRASWGQGYRYPSIAERFISTEFGLEVFANPELLPETGWSAELGWNLGIKAKEWLFLFDLSLFYMEYEDMIEFNFGTLSIGDTNPFGFQAVNIGGTIIQGTEVQIKSQKSFGKNNSFSFVLGYNYIDPSFKTLTEEIKANSTSEENILKYRQKHQAKANFVLELGKFQLGSTYRYLSKTEAVDAIFYVPFIIQGVKEFDNDHNNDRHIFDAMLAYNFPHDLRVQFNVKNIGNLLYSVRPALAEEIRSYTFRVSKKISYK